MYKLWLLFAILIFNIHANEIEEKSLDNKVSIYNSNSVLTSNDYIIALSSYKLGNYNLSYNQFKKLFLRYSDNVEINYYMALSASHIKLYDEATAAFERVLIVKPEFHRARLEYARILFILGFKEDSKKEFLKVAQYPIPENVRANINRYLEQIDNLNNATSTFIAISFGYMFDDNINSGIDSITYNLPGFFNLSVDGEKPQSSSAYFSSLQLNHIHGLFKDSPLILKHTGFVYYKNQTTNNRYNFNFYSYKPTLYYNNVKNKEEYSLQLGIDKILPGDNNDFMAYSISPIYKKLVDKDTIFSLFATYKKMVHDNSPNKTRDYDKKGVGFSLEFKKLIYTLNFEKDEKQNGIRTDVDKNIVENSFSYNYDIKSTLILSTQYQYRQINYSQKDLFFESVREDINRNFYMGITKIINKKDFITLSYTHTNNSSNQAAYDYDKNSVMLNYTWRFKL